MQPNDTNALAVLQARLAARRRNSLLDIRTTLRHFALITYAVPKERLQPHIPEEQFEIQEFRIGGKPMALLSVVPFYDVNFRFYRLLPFLKFSCGQTNHRAYVIHRASGEPCVWFFGTTLGSRTVHCSRLLWRLPWHYARYEVDCEYDHEARRYTRYRYRAHSQWCDTRIELADSGMMASLAPGFDSLEQQQLILTHPVTGYFRRLDGNLGTYSIWHPEFVGTQGAVVDLYCSLYERLGILNREEMLRPHSVFVSPAIDFEIYLPPKRV